MLAHFQMEKLVGTRRALPSHCSSVEKKLTVKRKDKIIGNHGNCQQREREIFDEKGKYPKRLYYMLLWSLKSQLPKLQLPTNCFDVYCVRMI